MAQTSEGARKIQAARAGVTVDEYATRRDAGEKFCGRCDRWHDVSAFGSDSSRSDGLVPYCRRSKNRRERERYQPKPPVPKGRRYVDARNGDKKQARRRVNYYVEAGLWPNPNELPCVDCGHIGDGPRHEYDHHLGYDAQHHEDVECVCAPCHHERESLRTMEKNDG